MVDELKFYKGMIYALAFAVTILIGLNVATLMILDDVVEIQQSHINLTVDDSMRINNLEMQVYHGYHDEMITVDVDAINGTEFYIPINYTPID